MSLIFPMYAMVLLNFVVLGLMFRARRRALSSGQMRLSYFKTYQSSHQEPEAVLITARHFSNLFEMPVLFYAVCLAAMIMRFDGYLMQVLAWAFVGCRIIHAWVHLSSNHIIYRMLSFAGGCLILLVMWTFLVLAHLPGPPL